MDIKGEDEEIQDEDDLYYHDEDIRHKQRKLLATSVNKHSQSRRRRTKEHDTNRTENLMRGIDKVSEKANQDEVQNKINKKLNIMDKKNQQELQKQSIMADKNQKLEKRNKMADANQLKLGNQNKKANKIQYKLQKHDKMGEENQYSPPNQTKIEKENLQKRNSMMKKDKHTGRNDEIPAPKDDKEPIVQVKHMKLSDKSPIQDQRSETKPHVIYELKNDTRNISLSKSKQENLQPGANDSISQRHPHDTVHHHDDYINPPYTHMRESVLRKGGDFEEVGVATTHGDVLKEDVDPWAMYGDSEIETGIMSEAAFDPEIRWNQTFQVSHTDFQSLRSDWIDLSCNVSGNLLISQSEVTALVQAFMEKLKLKYPRYGSLHTSHVTI